MDRILALIPARGGSKGIPRKNLLPLAGKPLIAYAIGHAKASSSINRCIVSTDDAEIAAAACEYGAEVPFMRPPEYAQDLSPDIDVFRHALSWLREHENYVPDFVVHLRPTGPIRRAALIDSAISQLRDHPEADSLRSVMRPIQTPYKMWRIEGDCLEPLLRVPGMDDCQSVPRQMLPEVYWQNGYVDVVRPRAVLEMNSMWGRKALPFVVDEPLFELDYPEDIPHVEDGLRRLAMGDSFSAPKRRHAT